MNCMTNTDSLVVFGIIWIWCFIYPFVTGVNDTSFNVPDDIIIQARCQARCYDLFGIDVDDYVIQRNCSTSNCKQCLHPCTERKGKDSVCDRDGCTHNKYCLESCSFVKSIVNTSSLHKAKYEEGIISTPKIVCQNVLYGKSSCPESIAIMYIGWDITRDLQGKSPAYIILTRYKQKKDVISDWKISETIVMSDFAEIKCLYASTDYQFQVIAVMSDGMYSFSKPSDWNTTQGNGYKAPTPYSMNVSEPVIVNQRPSVTVTWDPGKDASCYFTIFWFDPSGFKQKEIKTPWKHRFTINDLAFSKNYTIRLFSTDDTFQHTSDAKLMHVMTPDCLESTSFNHTVCAPLKPNNLSLEVLTPFHMHIDVRYVNVTLTWDFPLNSHYGRDIIRYHLSYAKQPFSNADNIIPNKGEKIFDGSWTSGTLENLHNHNRYRFELIAESAGGKGESAVLEQYIETSHENNTSDGLRSLDEMADHNKAVSSTNLSVLELMAVILVPTILCIILVVVVGFIVFKRRHKYKKYSSQRRFGPVEEMNPIYDGMALNLDKEKLAQFDADGYEIDYTCLDFISVIGEGAFGKVVKAEYFPNPADRGVTEGKIVAVKMLRDFYTGDESRNFLLEIQAMKSLGHFPHIVSIIGCCLTGPKLCLIMDYCALGDLRNYLRKYREKLMYNITSPSYGSISNSPNCYMQDQIFSRGSVVPDGDGTEEISEVQLLSYARQVTMGMEFLEKRKFVHRDLAARNILLYDHRHAKISDFGLTRDVYETNVYQPTSARKLPYKWMAIESLFSQRFTVQSDVWSFGIVLWEIVTLGGSPYPSIPLKDLYGLLNEGYRMEKPENCSDKIYQIMLSCWHPNPHSRPSFTQLKHALEKLLEETMSYIDLSVEVSEDYFNESNNDSASGVTPSSQHTRSTSEMNADEFGEFPDTQDLCVDVHIHPALLDITDKEVGIVSCGPEAIKDDGNSCLQNLLSGTQCEVCQTEHPMDCTVSQERKRCYLCSNISFISKSAELLKEKSKHMVKSQFHDSLKDLKNKAGSSSMECEPLKKKMFSSLTNISDTKGSISTSI